jgi:hypothetical protein
VGQWIDKAQKDLALSGLASGLLLTTRIAAGVTLPVIALYMLWVAALCYRPGILRSIGHFAFGLIPGLALLAWYNIARFGTPLASGYATEQGQFTTPLAVGLYGLLLSPGKSVLLFAPPLILALPGARALWRRGRADLVLLCAGLFLSHLLLYALWDVWQGGGVWGPRFLLPVVAVGMLPAAALGGPREAHPHVKVRLGLRACVGALAILGFLGNLGGALFNFSTYVNSTAEAARVYSLIGSPLIGHWRALAGRWGNYLAPPPTCALGDGWYASESAAGASLPRRSGASGELRCRVPTGSHLSFTLDDRRPPEAPPSYLRLTLNGRDIGPTRVGQRRIYRLVLPASALLEIRATPWNPHAIGFSSRDDQLGPVLADLGGASPAGAVIAVVDTAVAPLPADPRARWAWYYDPPNQHFADLWLWYLPRSELAGPRAWLLAGLLLLVGTASIAGGISALRPMRPRAARLHRP